MAKGKVGNAVGSLGDYLREQRTAASLSLRQLAEQAGVSNPYLSQIERGLRKPSAEVLQQIAKALRISAEQLYVRAGIVSPEDGVGGSVELAVLNDTGLTERQKRSEEHTSELQSRQYLVCRLLLEKKLIWESHTW